MISLLHSLTYISKLTCHRVWHDGKLSKMTGTISGAGTAYPPGAHQLNPGFQWGSCYSIFSFMCMLCRSLQILLFFFGPCVVCPFSIYRFRLPPFDIFKLFLLQMYNSLILILSSMRYRPSFPSIIKQESMFLLLKFVYKSSNTRVHIFSTPYFRMLK